MCVCVVCCLFVCFPFQFKTRRHSAIVGIFFYHCARNTVLKSNGQNPGSPGGTLCDQMTSLNRDSEKTTKIGRVTVFRVKQYKGKLIVLGEN